MDRIAPGKIGLVRDTFNVVHWYTAYRPETETGWSFTSLKGLIPQGVTIIDERIDVSELPMVHDEIRYVTYCILDFSDGSWVYVDTAPTCIICIACLCALTQGVEEAEEA